MQVSRHRLFNVELIKGQNIKKYINDGRELKLMCKTDAKTRQQYFFTAPQNVLQKLKKMALQKTRVYY